MSAATTNEEDRRDAERKRADDRRVRVLADVAKIAGEVGFKAERYGNSVQLSTPAGSYEGSVCAEDSRADKLLVESSRRGARSTRVWTTEPAPGEPGWMSKLKEALRFRFKRAVTEEKQAAENAANQARREANEAAGRAKFGQLPPDVRANYQGNGSWLVEFESNDHMSVEEVAAVGFALRLAAPLRARRVSWRDNEVREAVAALKKSLRFQAVADMDLERGEST